jgi:hypothetical protein
MPWSMTHSMLTGHPKWFENQTGNRPRNRVNSNSTLTFGTASTVT